MKDPLEVPFEGSDSSKANRKRYLRNAVIFLVHQLNGFKKSITCHHFVECKARVTSQENIQVIATNSTLFGSFLTGEFWVVEICFYV